MTLPVAPVGRCVAGGHQGCDCPKRLGEQETPQRLEASALRAPLLCHPAGECRTAGARPLRESAVGRRPSRAPPKPVARTLSLLVRSRRLVTVGADDCIQTIWGVGPVGAGPVSLARDRVRPPQLLGGRAHLGGDRVELGHEGLEVRLGEVAELVIGVVPEVVGALAALARLWVVRALRPGDQELVRLGDQPQPLVQSLSATTDRYCCPSRGTLASGLREIGDQVESPNALRSDRHRVGRRRLPPA